MNNVQSFPFLENWCKAYYEKCGLKVHPSSVPVDVVLNDLMGDFANLVVCVEEINKEMFALAEARKQTSEFIAEQNAMLWHNEKDLLEAKARISALENPVQTAELQPKKAKK